MLKAERKKKTLCLFYHILTTNGTASVTTVMFK